MTRLIVAILVLLTTGCMTQPNRPPEPISMGGIVYPPGAAARHIEGYAVVGYDVTTDGTVTNAEIIESVPPGVFDEAALDAVRTWRFQPAIRKGQLVQYRLMSPVRFKLGESEKYVR
jgi:protein TonB